MNKLIIENRTNRSMLDILPYIEEVVRGGYISNDNTQYCYASTWPDGIAIVSGKNDKSDRLVIYYDEKLVRK